MATTYRAKCTVNTCGGKANHHLSHPWRIWPSQLPNRIPVLLTGCDNQERFPKQKGRQNYEWQAVTPKEGLLVAVYTMAQQIPWPGKLFLFPTRFISLSASLKNLTWSNLLQKEEQEEFGRVSCKGTGVAWSPRTTNLLPIPLSSSRQRWLIDKSNHTMRSRPL